MSASPLSLAVFYSHPVLCLLGEYMFQFSVTFLIYASRHTLCSDRCSLSVAQQGARSHLLHFAVLGADVVSAPSHVHP